ncbi:hypothetical protein [Prochlorococcus marinus]|uniref:hypothetical protein n=1 Tax=Prochlorococcus marinus TaxID=1219 RepID=UPI0022B5937A|nr:hypothetical protein [Prochlorococcus marinus]
MNFLFVYEYFFSVALALGPVEIGLTLFAGLGFLLMFGYSSFKGGYQDLIETTLKNDELRREERKKNLK